MRARRPSPFGDIPVVVDLGNLTPAQRRDKQVALDELRSALGCVMTILPFAPIAFTVAEREEFRGQFQRIADGFDPIPHDFDREWWIKSCGEIRTPIICAGEEHKQTGKWFVELQHRKGGLLTRGEGHDMPSAFDDAVNELRKQGHIK